MAVIIHLPLYPVILHVTLQSSPTARFGNCSLLVHAIRFGQIVFNTVCKKRLERHLPDQVCSLSFFSHGMRVCLHLSAYVVRWNILDRIELSTSFGQRSLKIIWGSVNPHLWLEEFPCPSVSDQMHEWAQQRWENSHILN
jgi:hypothetical protein